MLRGGSRRARPWGTIGAQACCGGGCRRKDYTRRRAPIHQATPLARRATLPIPRLDRRRALGQAQPMRPAHYGVFRDAHGLGNLRSGITTQPKAAQQIILRLIPFFAHHARRAFRARASAQSAISSSAKPTPRAAASSARQNRAFMLPPFPWQWQRWTWQCPPPAALPAPALGNLPPKASHPHEPARRRR